MSEILARWGRAWRYARGKSTGEDLVRMSTEGDRMLGWYPVMSLCAEDVLEGMGSAGYVDTDALRELIDEACLDISLIWEVDHSSLLDAAVAKTVDLAGERGIELKREDGNA